jgi:hypothetical protein
MDFRHRLQSGLAAYFRTVPGTVICLTDVSVRSRPSAGIEVPELVAP